MEIKKIAQLIGHQAAVFAVGEGRTPQHIISGAGDGWLVEWDLAKPNVGQLLAKVERNIFALQYIKTQNRIVVGDMDGGVRFVDLNNSEKTLNIKHHSKGCFDMQLFENQLFTIGGEGNITRWSTEENRSLESLQLSAKSLRSLDISVEKREIVVGASDGNVYFLDLDTFDLKKTLKAAHTNSVFSARFSPDSKQLLTGGRDALLKLWTLGTPQSCRSLDGAFAPYFEKMSVPAHLFTLNSIALHPTLPRFFATASRDKTIKIWNIEGENLVLSKVIDTIRHGCHIRSVNRLFWSNYNDYLISVSDDRSLIVWKITI